MKSRNIINSLVVFFLLVSSYPGNISAQKIIRISTSLYSYTLDKFGYDPVLVDGIQYYNAYHNVMFHPFYEGENCVPGAVTVSGKHFDNQFLNYDIYNQRLILEYKETSGGIHKIILDPLKTEAFRLKDNVFEKLVLDENGPQFYQVLNAEKLTCYIHWKKKLLTTSGDLQYAEYFTNPTKTLYLKYNGTVYSFSNNWNFISLFPKPATKPIRKYMRKNYIRMRSVTLHDLYLLLEYVSNNHL